VKRSGLLIAGLLLAAAPLAAQDLTTPAPARLSITPFVGVRTPFISKGSVTLESGGQRSTAYFGQTPPEQSGGLTAGAEVELRLAGPLSVLGAASYSRVGVPFDYDGRSDDVGEASLWLAKASLAVRLPEPRADARRFRPSAVLSAGPAVVREDPREVSGAPEGAAYRELTKPINHRALNLAAKATTPLSPRLGVQLGFENFITFWNDAERDRRLERIFRDEVGVPVLVRYRSDVSHIFLLSAGLSLRL
jgi:hypothetical protein